MAVGAWCCASSASITGIHEQQQQPGLSSHASCSSCRQLLYKHQQWQNQAEVQTRLSHLHTQTCWRVQLAISHQTVLTSDCTDRAAMQMWQMKSANKAAFGRGWLGCESLRGATSKDSSGLPRCSRSRDSRVHHSPRLLKQHNPPASDSNSTSQNGLSVSPPLQESVTIDTLSEFSALSCTDRLIKQCTPALRLRSILFQYSFQAK